MAATQPFYARIQARSKGFYLWGEIGMSKYVAW
jgi:predicted ATPase